jgi:lactoylglutathione lyase
MHVHHTAIQVSEPQRAIAFYRRLGLDLVGCFRVDPIVLFYVSAPAGGARLELVHNPAAEDRAAGSGHVAVAVDNFDELLAHLSDSGIALEREPYHPGNRPDRRVCFLRDPDGTLVELLDGEFPTPQDPLPEGVA